MDMISPTLDSLRTALHLLGVAVWVGGQIVLAGIVPAVRGVSRDATVLMARGFARLAWPSLLLVVFTGVWAFADIDPAEIPRAKYDFDVTGHYARPDVFELTVDTRAKTPVREI